MITIGLTGSIGMGKTTVARQLEEFGAKVCHADAIVHALLAQGGAAVEAVAAQFPGVLASGAIDRKKLGNIVFHDEEKMLALEKILHPLVVAEENAFIEKSRGEGAAIAVLDIPLLYETGGEKRCDVVIVATAPYIIQKQRVMKRSGMTAEKFARILMKQMPDREKRRRADFVVQTGLGKAYSRYRIKAILGKLHAA